MYRCYIVFCCFLFVYNVDNYKVKQQLKTKKM